MVTVWASKQLLLSRTQLCPSAIKHILENQNDDDVIPYRTLITKNPRSQHSHAQQCVIRFTPFVQTAVSEINF